LREIEWGLILELGKEEGDIGTVKRLSVKANRKRFFWIDQLVIRGGA
jgi:hypothetical protein